VNMYTLAGALQYPCEQAVQGASARRSVPMHTLHIRFAGLKRRLDCLVTVYLYIAHTRRYTTGMSKQSGNECHTLPHSGGLSDAAAQGLADIAR